MSDLRRDELFDRELRAFLSAEAEDRRGVPSITEMAMRISAVPRVASAGRGLNPSFAWLILVALLAIALAGAVLIGVGGRRELAVAPAPSAGSTMYEPVFLRLEGSELAVVRVDGHGDETELMRLSDANLTGNFPYGGAVSTSGLLAVPRPAALRFHWEIFDLSEPEADPILVPGTEQDREPFLGRTPYLGSEATGGAFWGPSDQLAIVSSDRIPLVDLSGFDFRPYLTFVDGRTAEARRVDLPNAGETVLAQWVPDGSGVLLADRQSGQVTGVLRQDGTVGREIPQAPWSFCDDIAQAGTDCQSPDRSMVVRMPRTVDPLVGPTFDVPDGTWAGWLDVSS